MAGSYYNEIWREERMLGEGRRRGVCFPLMAIDSLLLMCACVYRMLTVSGNVMTASRPV